MARPVVYGLAPWFKLHASTHQVVFSLVVQSWGRESCRSICSARSERSARPLTATRHGKATLTRGVGLLIFVSFPTGSLRIRLSQEQLRLRCFAASTTATERAPCCTGHPAPASP